MKIEAWPTAKIKPYEHNPRLNDSAVDAVAESIRQFGFRQPIVVDRDGVIVCGHTRWKAAQKLGLVKVPVHVALDLTPEQVRAYRIADNRAAELSQWDYDSLMQELAELKEAGADVTNLGWDAKEIERMLAVELTQDADGKDFDESAAADVPMIVCPKCGHEFQV